MKYRFMNSNDIDIIRDMEVKMRITDPGVFKEFNDSDFTLNFQSRNIEDLENYDTILGFKDGELIARIDLMFEQSFMDFKKVGYVDWVYVMKPYRRQGVAEQLFKEAEKYFRNLDCVLYYLFVAENIEAQGFYKKIDIDINTIERASKLIK